VKAGRQETINSPAKGLAGVGTGRQSAGTSALPDNYRECGYLA